MPSLIKVIPKKEHQVIFVLSSKLRWTMLSICELEARDKNKKRSSIIKFNKNTWMNIASRASCWLKSKYFFMSYHACLGIFAFIVLLLEKINTYNHNCKTNSSKLKLLPPSPTGYSYWVPGASETQWSPKHHPLFPTSAAPTTQLIFGCWYSLMEMCSCIFSILFLTFPLPPPHHSILCHELFVCISTQQVNRAHVVN